MSRKGQRGADGDRCNERGQILPIAVFVLIGLLGISALAIDAAGAFLSKRWQSVVADAAALAGAQSLQIPGSRALPGSAEQGQARTNAMKVLVDQLGASSIPTAGSCFTSARCALPGTPYEVSIRTPSPSCVDCDSQRAVQVTIHQPNFGVTFARLFGPDSWQITASSVAGMVHARQYGIVTLRPPNPRNNGGDFNEDDLSIAGGSKVIVKRADVMTNTNLVCPGGNSELVLDLASGFDVHYFAPYKAWETGSKRCVNPPPGTNMTSPVDIPGYSIPQRTTSMPIYTSEAQAVEPDEEKCKDEQRRVPAEYRELKNTPARQINLPYDPITAPLGVKAVCYRPGIYQFTLTARDNASGPPEAVLLTPGVYFFDAGVRVQASFIGGYEPNKPGVALVFKEAKNSSGIPGQFTTTNNTSLVALNFGDAYCPGPAGTTCPSGRSWASPAEGPQGPVQSTPPNPVLLTVMVEPVDGCKVGVEAPPASDCKESENKTLQLTGGGNIFLAGIQFAPSDNAVLAGNSGQRSDIGAFWAWTLVFTGGSEFNLAGREVELTGVLRLDPACSPTVTVCNQ